MITTRTLGVVAALTLSLAGQAAAADLVVPDRGYSYVPAQREYVVTERQYIVTEPAPVVVAPAPVVVPPPPVVVAPVAPYGVVRPYARTYVQPYPQPYVVRRSPVVVEAPGPVEVADPVDIDAYAAAPRCVIDAYGYRRCY